MDGRPRHYLLRWLLGPFCGKGTAVRVVSLDQAVLEIAHVTKVRLYDIICQLLLIIGKYP